MKKFLVAASFLAIATSAAWAQAYVYPPYGYGGAGYYNYAVPYVPQPYAAPGFYGFYGFDPTAHNWDYYRTDSPGRGNNVESTR